MHIPFTFRWKYWVLHVHVYLETKHLLENKRYYSGYVSAIYDNVSRAGSGSKFYEPHAVTCPRPTWAH